MTFKTVVPRLPRSLPPHVSTHKWLLTNQECIELASPSYIESYQSSLQPFSMVSHYSLCFIVYVEHIAWLGTYIAILCVATRGLR